MITSLKGGNCPVEHQASEKQMVQADPVFRSRPATCPRAVVIRESSVHLSKPFFQSRNLCNQGGESFKIVATVQPPQYLQAKTLQKWNFETQRLPRPVAPAAPVFGAAGYPATQISMGCWMLQMHGSFTSNWIQPSMILRCLVTIPK